MMLGCYSRGISEKLKQDPFSSILLIMNGFVLLSASVYIYISDFWRWPLQRHSITWSSARPKQTTEIRSIHRTFLSCSWRSKNWRSRCSNGKTLPAAMRKERSLFSTNIGAFYLPIGNVSCDSLPTDKYNESDKLKANHTLHHYSIMVSLTIIYSNCLS